MDSPLIQFKNVNKSFGGIRALESIDFDIQKGDFVFIVGPSGAGKTTILKILLAEYKPTSGEVTIDGQKLTEIRRKDIPRYRQKIGIVFQDFKLLGERTVRENIEVPLAVKGVPEEEWLSRVDQVLKLVGLSARADLFPSQLSGGEIQRVAIARALITNPMFIFADEPTGNLDWDTAESIMDLLLKINLEGKTIIVTSHHKSLVHKLKKRIIEMKNGKIVADSQKSKKEAKEEEKRHE